MRNKIKQYCKMVCKRENLPLKHIKITELPPNAQGVCSRIRIGNKTFNHQIEFCEKVLKFLNSYGIKHIILHEVAHLKYFNHSKKFYDYFKKLMYKYPKFK